MELSLFFQFTVNGLLLGGLYALLAAGFSLTWGVIGIVNLAYGEFMLLGGLWAWTLSHPTGMTEVNLLLLVAFALAQGFVLGDFLLRPLIANVWNRRAIGYLVSGAICAVIYVLWSISGFRPFDPLLTLPIITITFFGLGHLLQNTLLNRLVGAREFKFLLATFALKVVLEQGMKHIYGSSAHTLDLRFGGGFWRIAQSNVTIAHNSLIAWVIALLLIFSFSIFLRRTRAGYAIRAAAQHRMAARLVGISLPRIYAMTFGIGLALAGSAGVLFGTFQPLMPDAGLTWTLRACAVAALSGFAPVENVLIGGVLLGLTEAYISGYGSPGWGLVVPFAILLLLLIARPQRLRLERSV